MKIDFYSERKKYIR